MKAYWTKSKTRKISQKMLLPDQLLPQLPMIVNELKNKNFTWQIPLGDINRFQRLSGDINLVYNDTVASFTHRLWTKGSWEVYWLTKAITSKRHQEALWI
jgi:hypothetical protein